MLFYNHNPKPSVYNISVSMWPITLICLLLKIFDYLAYLSSAEATVSFSQLTASSSASLG